MTRCQFVMYGQGDRGMCCQYVARVPVEGDFVGFGDAGTQHRVMAVTLLAVMDPDEAGVSALVMLNPKAGAV